MPTLVYLEQTWPFLSVSHSLLPQEHIGKQSLAKSREQASQVTQRALTALTKKYCIHKNKTTTYTRDSVALDVKSLSIPELTAI